MDPLLKLAVDVQNSEKIKELTAYLDAQKVSVNQLNTSFKAGAITQKEYTTWVGNLAPGIQSASKELHGLQSASGTAGRGLSQLAYAVDDVQYGFNAIVNNIPQIVLGLGGSAGIAGAVGIAAVAINQLIKHWGDLTDAFNAWTSDKTVEQLERIRKKNEEVAESYQRVKAAKTAAEKKETSEREEAIIEGPFEEIRARTMAGLLMSKNKKIQESIEAEYSVDAKTGERTLVKSRVQKAEEVAERLMGGGAKTDAEKAIIAGATTESKAKLAKPAVDKENRELQIEDRQKRNELAAHEATGQAKNRDELHKQELEEEKEDHEWSRWARQQRERQQKEVFDAEKRKRIEALEDQRDAILKNPPRQAQIMSAGARDAVAYYQKAAGMDAKKVKLLEDIREALKKERRLVLAK